MKSGEVVAAGAARDTIKDDYGQDDESIRKLGKPLEVQPWTNVQTSVLRGAFRARHNSDWYTVLVRLAEWGPKVIKERDRLYGTSEILAEEVR